MLEFRCFVPYTNPFEKEDKLEPLNDKLVIKHSFVDYN